MSDENELFTDIEPSKSPELRWLEEAKAAGIDTLWEYGKPGFEWSAWGEDDAQVAYGETEREAMDNHCAAFGAFPTFDQWRLGKEAK